MRLCGGRSESYLYKAVNAAAQLLAYYIYSVNGKFFRILRAVLAEDNGVFLRHYARDEHRAAERAESLALTYRVVHYAPVPADDIALYIDKIALTHILKAA